jgi:hypothetical protein
MSAIPTATQTDAKSPINVTLMEGIRTNLGGYGIGEVFWVHTYNGIIAARAGCMKCDGRIINEANYDAEHTTDWADDVGTTALDGKYLPNLVGKYPLGASTTTQTGATAITAVGNASHQVNLQHTHTGPSHNHMWYNEDGSGNDAKSFSSGGGSQDLNIADDGGTGIARSSGNTFSDDLYTDMAGTGATGNGGSTTQNVQPESIELVPYMKIV